MRRGMASVASGRVADHDENSRNQKMKKWYEISEDELNHRMMVQKSQRIIPVSAAVKEFDRAVDRFIRTLGVNPDLEESIGWQMEQLGIVRWENVDERTPQLWGWFFAVMKRPLVLVHEDDFELEPVGWVSAPKMRKDGTAYCKVEDWRKGTLTETEGVKVVQ
jgi:hypothetical protein